MKKLSIIENEFKNGLEITFKGLKDLSMDWHIDIRKYIGGGYKFFINAASASYDYAYHEYGDCSGDYVEQQAFKGERNSKILNDYVRDLMDKFTTLEFSAYCYDLEKNNTTNNSATKIIGKDYIGLKEAIYAVENGIDEKHLNNAVKAYALAIATSDYIEDVFDVSINADVYATAYIDAKEALTAAEDTLKTAKEANKIAVNNEANATTEVTSAPHNFMAVYCAAVAFYKASIARLFAVEDLVKAQVYSDATASFTKEVLDIYSANEITYISAYERFINK